MEAKIALAIAGVVLVWGFVFYWMSLKFFARRSPDQVVNYLIGKGYSGPDRTDPELFAERIRIFLGPLIVLIFIALIAMSIHFTISLGFLVTHLMQHGYMGNEAAAGACAVEFALILFGLCFVRVLERLRGACRGYIWKRHPAQADTSTWTPSPLT